MDFLRPADPSERKDCLNLLPYILEPYVAEVYVPRFSNFKVFYDRVMEKGLTTQTLFKGVDNAEEIVASGGLKCEKSHHSGCYSVGAGIYLADDPLKTLGYGKEILVVDTACKWYTRIQSTNKQATPEEILSAGYDGLYAMNYDVYSDYSEYICFRNEAMNIRYVFTFNEHIGELTKKLRFN